jgi:hypothetical protein
LDHYLEVTEAIEPHPKLAFSIKHTALDFWRRVKVNECLTQGRHPQIIEVQCQREYEGKGAYPNYVMDGVINGFEENVKKIGLQELMADPRVLGVYAWSRGGGWFGPYLQDELWPDLNAFVLAQFASNPNRTEEEIFHDYAERKLGLQGADGERFRQISQLSARVILKGRHCEVFDRALAEAVLPTACWMRDDRLGGRHQLRLVLDYILARDLGDEALREKAEAVSLCQEMKALVSEIQWPDSSRGEFARISVEYARLLFSIVEQGWRVLIFGRHMEEGQRSFREELAEAIQRYDVLWSEYRKLADAPLCPSLYQGHYFSLPGAPAEAGMDESVDYYRKLITPG